MKEGKAISTQVKHEFLEKVKKIVEETHNDPKGRTTKIANEFGFELVTIDDTAD